MEKGLEAGWKVCGGVSWEGIGHLVGGCEGWDCVGLEEEGILIWMVAFWAVGIPEKLGGQSKLLLAMDPGALDAKPSAEEVENAVGEG